MGKTRIIFRYNFDDIPYSDGRDTIHITDHDFIYSVDIDDEMSYKTVRSLKEEFFNDAFEKAVYNQMSEYGSFLNSSFN